MHGAVKFIGALIVITLENTSSDLPEAKIDHKFCTLQTIIFVKTKKFAKLF